MGKAITLFLPPEMQSTAGDKLYMEKGFYTISEPINNLNHPKERSWHFVGEKVLPEGFILQHGSRCIILYGFKQI